MTTTDSSLTVERGWACLICGHVNSEREDYCGACGARWSEGCYVPLPAWTKLKVVQQEQTNERQG